MKSGISLVVLVVTIIVMIILAGTIVLTLNESSILRKANEAVELTDFGQIKNLAAIKWAEEYFKDYESEDELKSAVIQALKDEGVDTDKYKIEVSFSGVDVFQKEKSVEANAIVNRLEDVLLNTNRY